MTLGERYYQLSRLGRDTFCASVAQATLVRVMASGPEAPPLAVGIGSGISTVPRELDDASAAMFARQGRTDSGVQELIPLVKKLGTPFVDLITLGRTDGNDIQLADTSISRFQAFFRRQHGNWYVCDAGSSNGTRVDGRPLKARTEKEILSHMELRFGSVDFHFHTADSLYDVLASRPATHHESEDLV
ncbi:MAG: FHA domain-containing protein [Myxococcales bacterium]|nr:FHA domain-containing protein [Myxococcales bacterium]